MSNANVDERRCQEALVSFIVPALNEEKHISRCLTSIQRLIRPAELSQIEIIVVDNQSTDRTVPVSKEFGAEIIVVLPGYPSRARNAGARAAKGNWLAFIDADCELAPNWLTTCAAHLLADSQIVAAGGAVRAPGQDTSWVERAWHNLVYTSNSSAKHVRWLPAFNLLVRRDMFQQIGGFNESLATCEDCDLGYKLSDVGKLILDSRTQAVHLGESHSLGELFRREAWRTQGNLRLALARPSDWSNWLSLLVPPCLLVVLLLSIGGAIVAGITGRQFWPSLGIAIAILCALVMIVLKKTRAINPLSVAKQMVVFITYLAGRTTGLIWSFRRVER